MFAKPLEKKGKKVKVQPLATEEQIALNLFGDIPDPKGSWYYGYTEPDDGTLKFRVFSETRSQLPENVKIAHPRASGSYGFATSEETGETFSFKVAD